MNNRVKVVNQAVARPRLAEKTSNGNQREEHRGQSLPPPLNLSRSSIGSATLSSSVFRKVKEESRVYALIRSSRKPTGTELIVGEGRTTSIGRRCGAYL